MLIKNIISCLSLLFILLWYPSCTNNPGISEQIKKVEVADVHVKRYDQALFEVPAENFQEGIKKIQNEFRPFLDVNLDDSTNSLQLLTFVNDTFIQQLQQTALVKFPNLKKPEKELAQAFRYIRYYFPDWRQPTVYSYISGLSDDQPVLYNGSDLIIALDHYLGSDFIAYRKAGVPLYRSNRMQADYLIADIAKEIANEAFINAGPYRHLLDKMISEGKLLFLLDSFLPHVADEYKIGFSKENIKWCKEHEKAIWAYLLEHQLLYANDPAVIKKFVNDGPFTTAFARESPARATLWVGWQIVRAYMKHSPETTLDELIDADAVKILTQSKYKPGIY